eukprot:10583822-Ditylum_brightwellii.AAC.1
MACKECTKSSSVNFCTNIITREIVVCNEYRLLLDKSKEDPVVADCAYDSRLVGTCSPDQHQKT